MTQRFYLSWRTERCAFDSVLFFFLSDWGSISTFTPIKGLAEDLTRFVDIGLAHERLGEPLRQRSSNQTWISFPLEITVLTPKNALRLLST